ncbi:Ca-activated chloride channel family protein [Lutibacter agarilyticus]|uniref:Ca-activated chloride channel family protein n=1 Tax=Lutibacter agarilyticus TaxID=1109740 RepID=A0A238Y205_9FLAO|nr:VWA domain-containing protein [Lutibacter agarilyticus]SNR64821.1 Ca-activated chloride channel family protein [Lutibacter agarilyticus]
MPENFEIAHLWVFWLLPLPILVYWLLPPLRLKSASLAIPNFKKVEEYTGEKLRNSALIKRKGFFKVVFLFIIWVLLLGAISSPQLVAEPELKVKTSRNFLIVADISFSMAQKDWVNNGQKVRRWDGVKSVVHDFIDKREGDRMGLIFFGSSAYIQAPFTPDLKTVDEMLEGADVGMAGQMTNIGKAIVKGIEMFDQDTIKTKVMLLLTDGIDAGTDILPLDAADLAKKDSILVYTIGIGDPNSGGSDLDERTLEQISELTDAQYFRAIDSERLNEIYEELNKLEPIEFEEEEFKPKTLLYFYPLGLALFLIILQSLVLSLFKVLKQLKNKNSNG